MGNYVAKDLSEVDTALRYLKNASYLAVNQSARELFDWMQETMSTAPHDHIKLDLLEWWINTGSLPMNAVMEDNDIIVT